MTTTRPVALLVSGFACCRNSGGFAGVDSPGHSASDLGSPVCCSRKTLIYLILTLNHIYPDYDFSQLRPHHFCKEDGLARTEETVDSHLLEVSKVQQGWPMSLLQSCTCAAA